jgi:hypothetical protein
VKLSFHAGCQLELPSPVCQNWMIPTPPFAALPQRCCTLQSRLGLTCTVCYLPVCQELQDTSPVCQNWDHNMSSSVCQELDNDPPPSLRCEAHLNVARYNARLFSPVRQELNNDLPPPLLQCCTHTRWPHLYARNWMMTSEAVRESRASMPRSMGVVEKPAPGPRFRSIACKRSAVTSRQCQLKPD